jgi:hypothetical protein
MHLALERIERKKPWARGIYPMPQFGRYDLVSASVI